MPDREAGDWYTRRDGVVRGPFATTAVTRYILLGRIGLDDEISNDRSDWETVSVRTGLLPEELQAIDSWQDYQQLVLARLSVDERRRQRRVDDKGLPTGRSTERRSGRERRQLDTSRLLMQRLFGAGVKPDPSPVFKRPAMYAALLLVVVLTAWLLLEVP